MNKIVIINGPNLNLLGVRETSVYGDRDFQSYFETLRSRYPAVDLMYFQSNHEGAIIDKIHEVGFSVAGIVLNAGAYTHTSLAIADAIAAVTAPVVEVHISNVYARESFRHHSYLAKNCRGVICGFGLDGYRLALESLMVQ
ncbi:type II 3-dehydroquinate dehydratase [Parapedobacter lycopersici]|uniref:type II 3-dehydroquinate dehydratase n=1 Tax=Parapedobacter lycopersici TaxID=1864939 RepID=UPI0033418881